MCVDLPRRFVRTTTTHESLRGVLHRKMPWLRWNEPCTLRGANLRARKPSASGNIKTSMRELSTRFAKDYRTLTNPTVPAAPLNVPTTFVHGRDRMLCESSYTSRDPLHCPAVRPSRKSQRSLCASCRRVPAHSLRRRRRTINPIPSRAALVVGSGTAYS